MRVKPEDARQDVLDELYAAEPGEFVATRERLAKALKADGDTAAAKALKAARKPPLAVWAVNQLARRHQDEVAALLEAGEALRRAQRKALSGVKAAGLREATEQRARAADRLIARAAAILSAQGAAPATHLPAVHTALVAAAADEDVAEALRRGRLDTLPEPPSGFGDAAGLALVPDLADDDTGDEAGTEPEAEPAGRKPAAAPPAPKGPTAAQRKALAAARSKAQEAAARAAERAAAVRAAAVRAAAARLKEAEQEAKDAERRARQARRDADQARRALEGAQAEAKAAEAASERAAAKLRGLEGGG